jgi:hypothetical protein
VFLGNGDGTFQKLQTSTDASGSVADVNSDGKPDILALSYGSGFSSIIVSLLLGNGDGTFQAAREIAVLKHTVPVRDQVMEVDVNGDGKPDIVTYNDDYYDGSRTISVLLNNGNGTFQPAWEVANGDYLGVAAVTDVNGDGKPDPRHLHPIRRPCVAG